MPPGSSTRMGVSISRVSLISGWATLGAIGEEDTLVVDVTLFNDQTWFDRAGNFHSEQLHLVERYTPISANHIIYEVTVEDPKVFTRPWTMRFPLYRRLEENVQVLDYECLEYEEPFLPWHESPAPGVPGAPGR